MIPRRVAFVDDNEAVRTALAHALGALPEIKVVATLEGPAELEQLVSAAPELVLIDFHLLGVRGDTFAEVVKARLPAASIWLMTASRRGIGPSSWNMIEKGELLGVLKGWLAYPRRRP